MGLLASWGPARRVPASLAAPLRPAAGLFLLLGLGMGLAAAGLIAWGQWHLLLPLLGAIPVALLFLRYPFAAVLLWLLVVPLVVRDTSTLSTLTFDLLHRLMVPGSLLLATVSSWVTGQRPVRYNRSDLALLLFLVLGVMNILLLTQNPFRNLTFFYDRLFVPLCMYWLVRTVQPTSQDLKWVVVVALVTVPVQFVVGLLSWFAPAMLPEGWLGRVGERTVGTLGNPAVYTSTLLFLAFFLLTYALGSTRRWLRTLCWLMFGLALFCVFFSFSRGSWLGGMLVLVGMLAIYPRIASRVLTMGTLIGLVLVVTVFSSFQAYALERLHDITTAQGRLLGGATAVAMIQQKPWFGWGFGQYDVYDSQFRTRVGDLAVREEQTSHNTFLLILSEFGIVGFALYFFPTGWWLIQSFRVRRSLPRAGFASWSFVALLWLALLDHFVVSNFMEMIHSNLFGTTIWWLALALIGALVSSYEQPHPRPGASRAASPGGRR